MELTGVIRGRMATPFHAEVVRELSEDDLLLRRNTAVGSEARPLVKLRYQHHRLAQLLAAGIEEGEASLLTGYCISRISILKADPAFRELQSHYEKNNREVYADLQGRMAGFAMTVLDEMQDRLDVSPETFTNKELIETVKVTNDRGGNAPIARSESKHVVLTAEDILAIKREVKESENGRIIEAGKTPYALPSNTGIEVGTLLQDPSINLAPAKEIERGESQRQDL